MLQGAIEYLREGGGLIALPASIQAATDGYLEDEDHFGRFIEDRCVIDTNGSATNGELKKHYASWCDSNRMHHAARNENEVIRELKKRGYPPYKSGSARGFRGIRINTAATVQPVQPVQPVS